ncbi:hypothetical protein [Thermoactinospora rubra]|uniref:hypothetical protein n=1 Tax=Thermoactinospora rubra TaxID=1088767 RepID=UPI000A105BEE|nr:hypothetical protein [Thermoactinospora rubra]
MKHKVQVALALAAGYYLGRRRKLRAAVALALAGAAGGLRRGAAGGLLQQGMKALGSSPQVEEMANRLRGELMEAGKAAAMAATTRQINSLADRLHERAESLRQPGPQAQEEPQAEEEEEYEEDEYVEEEPEEEEEPPRRTPASRRRPAATPGGPRR